MKVKNFQVYDEGNQKAISELMKKDLKGATALKVVKVARKLDEILKDIHQSIGIVRDKYTVKDENGKAVHPIENDEELTNKVKISDPQAFNKELEEILTIENDILPEIEMISEEEIKGVTISPQSLLTLSWLINV